MIELDLKGIGERIAGYRKMNGMSAQALADEAGAGLTRPIIANIESGRRHDIGISHLLAIAWALGVAPVALIFPIDDPELSIATGDGSLPVSELIPWFNGHRLDPFNIEVTMAGINASSTLDIYDSLARLEARKVQIKNEEINYNTLANLSEEESITAQRESENLDKDIATHKQILRMLGGHGG